MSSWNYTINRYSNNKNLFCVIASDRDSGDNSVINYFIPTISVPYFIINQTTGMIQIRDNVQISDFNITLFPIRFQVFAQDRGIPSLRSTETVSVTIYFDNNINPPLAEWIGQGYENIQMFISEKFYEINSNKLIIQSSCNLFNGSYFYLFSSTITSQMIIKSPFTESIPFRSDLLSSNNNIYSSGIYVNR
jgi:hypothetical protein